VITVGATDDQKTATITDDVVPDFSSRGPTAHGNPKPDVVAPGAHLVSLRAPGSAIDTAFPNVVDATYRQGSGTSMATAVVSGVAAQILSANPKFGPDRVKHVLAATARPVAGGAADTVGRGIVDAYAAGVRPPSGKANQGLLRSAWTAAAWTSRADRCGCSSTTPPRRS
jgi:serine protease AprX